MNVDCDLTRLTGRSSLTFDWVDIGASECFDAVVASDCSRLACNCSENENGFLDTVLRASICADRTIDYL